MAGQDRRALGGPYIDLMADGVPGLADTYGRGFDAAVWDALGPV